MVTLSGFHCVFNYDNSIFHQTHPHGVDCQSIHTPINILQHKFERGFCGQLEDERGKFEFFIPSLNVLTLFGDSRKMLV